MEIPFELLANCKETQRKDCGRHKIQDSKRIKRIHNQTGIEDTIYKINTIKYRRVEHLLRQCSQEG